MQIDAFIDPATEELARASAADLGNDTTERERALHLQVLRLIATVRRNERKAAQNIVPGQAAEHELPPTIAPRSPADWRDLILQRYPLQVRMAGREAMRLVNEQRLGPYGDRRDTKAGAATTFAPLSELIQAQDDPHKVEAHLRKAGFRTHGNTKPKYALTRPYPTDVQAYLAVYPVPLLPLPGEMDSHQMAQAFDTKRDRIYRIIQAEGLYPVVRIFEGVRAREVEFYEATSVAIVGEAVAAVPRIGEDEIFVNQLLRELGPRWLAERALRLSGVATPPRCPTGRGHPGRSILKIDIPRVRSTFQSLLENRAAASAAEPTAPAALEEEVDAQPEEQTWHSLEHIATTLEVPLNAVSNMLAFSPPTEENARNVPGETAAARMQLNADKTAEISRLIIGGRLRRRPDWPLDTEQIGLIVGRPQEEVAAQVEEAGIADNGQDRMFPTYWGGALDRIFDLFAISLQNDS